MKKVEVCTTEAVSEPETTVQDTAEVETTIPKIMEIETTQPEIKEQATILGEETEAETESETEQEVTEPSTGAAIKEPEPINTALYGINITKDSLEYDTEDDIYYVTEEINELSGTIKLSGEAQDSRILITNESGYTVLERDIKPEENFSVKNFGLVIGVNNVNVQVEYENGHVVNEEIIIYNYCEKIWRS